MRSFAVMTVLGVLLTACQSSDTTEVADTAGQQETTGTDEQQVSPDEGIDWNEMSIVLVPIDPPEGYSVESSANQGVAFNGATYLVATNETETALFRIGERGAEATPVSVAGAGRAEVFNTGGHVLFVAADPEGDMVIFSSSDGATFEEARVPIPDRYLEADVWEATSLLADAGGAADLAGSIYLIARIGINWVRPIKVMSDYAATISPELGEAAATAGTIRQAPQPDGDILFTFLRDDEVVFEALASEAGMEPGYQDAYDEFQRQEDADSGMTLSWIIEGTTATQTTNPPLDGGLDEELRLNFLYPVGEGVAALITDFSGEVGAMSGRLASNATSPNFRALLASGTEIAYTVNHTWDGETWEPAGTVGDPDGETPTIVYTPDDPAYGLLYNKNGEYIFAESEDGLDWEVPEYTIDISLPDGTTASIVKIGGETILMFDLGEGEFRSFTFDFDEETGETFVDEIGVIESVIPELNQGYQGYVAPTYEEVQRSIQEARTVGTAFGDILFPRYVRN